MKFVTKMVLIPIEDWEKVKKHLPTKKHLKYCGSGSDDSSETGTTDDEFWGKTGGHEEEEEGIFKSDGEEEEGCNFNN